jgi:protoporphyrinogen oxidase
VQHAITPRTTCPVQVDKDLRVMLLKPDAPKPKMVGVRVWPRAIPQFNVGHLEQLEKARWVAAAVSLMLAYAGCITELYTGNAASATNCLQSHQLFAKPASC